MSQIDVPHPGGASIGLDAQALQSRTNSIQLRDETRYSMHCDGTVEETRGKRQRPEVAFLPLIRPSCLENARFLVRCEVGNLDLLLDPRWTNLGYASIGRSHLDSSRR